MGAYTTVRLDDELGERLRAIAEQNGVAVSTAARRLIETALEGWRIESSEAFAALYGDEDRSVLVALARRWLPDGHPEIWRLYGRVDGPWAAPAYGYGGDKKIDAMIAKAHVLAPYRSARKKTLCSSERKLAIAVAAASGLGDITVEIYGEVDGDHLINLGVDRIILEGGFRGFRLPSSPYSISLRLPEANLSGIALKKTGTVTYKNIRDSGFLQFLLALSVIGDPDWRDAERQKLNLGRREPLPGWPPMYWTPRITLRVATAERQRRGRGWLTLYRTYSIPFSAADEITRTADEAARRVLGNGLPDILSATADAFHIAHDEGAALSYKEDANVLLDWLVTYDLTSPLVLLDWVPCIERNRIFSSLYRVTHLNNEVYTRPQLPKSLERVAENFARSEGVRRAAVGLLLRKALDL